MFKQFWKDDYDFYSSQKGYARGKSVIYYIMIAFILFFNYALMSTPVNAYMESGSAFTIENFTDYKSIDQCNYSLSATKSDGTIKDAESQITMNCYTLDNTNPLANDYVYIKTSDKIYQAKYYDWVSADDLTFNEKYTYLASLEGSPLLTSSKHPTQEGITIYSPTETDYLKATGQTWDYYKILQFVPSWVSENKFIYENSSNGNVYYSIDETVPGYINDSYYKYDRNGNVVYNQLSELADIKVDYLYYDGNAYGYGNTKIDGSEMSVGGYYDDFVTLTNVNKALYKLQHYEHTYNNVDINGVAYGSEGFVAESYFKDGIYYLWDTSENLFYAYEINTLQDLGFISEEEVIAQKNAGISIINKDTEKNLISNVRKYREFFETTYTLESSVQETNGTTTEVSKTPVSTNNTYTRYEISENPISYDSRYSYYWTYVTEYLYEYISQFKQMKYKYSIQPQVKTDLDQTTTTYTLSQTSQETTTGDPAAGYGLCSSLASVGSGTKCYTSATLSTYKFSDKYTTTIYSKNTSGSVHNEIGNLNYSESKVVYIGGAATTIYKTSNGWVYWDDNAVKYREYLQTDTYNISEQSTGTATYSYENTSLAMSKNLNSVPLSNGTTFTLYGGYTTSDVYENRIRNKYRYISESNEVKYYEGDIPSDVTNNTKSDISEGLKSGNSYFYVSKGNTGNYLYDYKEIYYPYFIFLKIYNKTDGYTYYAAPTASYESGFKAIENTYPSNDGGHWNCDGICVTAQQDGLLTGDIWYQISESEYSDESFAFASKSQGSLPEHASRKSGWIHHRNATVASKVAYNTYYGSGTSRSTKTINIKGGGTAQLKYGYSSFSRQSSVPSGGKTDGGLTVSVNYGYYRFFTQTASYAQKKYMKYTVAVGQDSQLTTNVKNGYANTYNSDNMIWYYGDYTTESVKTGTNYIYPYKTFKVTLSSTGGYTGWYRASYGGINYYYADNTSGFDTAYTSTRQSTNTSYSVSSMNYNTSSASIVAKSLSYNNSNGYINYYKPITSSTKEVVVSDGNTAPGVTASSAAQNLKSNYSNAIQSASGSGNTLSITYVDGTRKNVTGIPYKRYTYYNSTSTVDGVSGDSSGSYANNGSLYYSSYETKPYGSSSVRNVVPSSTSSTNQNTSNPYSVSIKTVVTTVKTTVTTRDVYTFVGMEDTSNIIKLYNENVSSSISADNALGYKGNKDSLTGTYTTLTECSSSSTGVCYKHINTVNNRQLDAKTMDVTSIANYSQPDKSDNSHAEGSNAYYKNHIPTATEAHSSDYERRICSSTTDTNCYWDSPRIEVSFTPRYSIKTITTTYQVKATESNNPIYYNSNSSNSTLNTFAEFGTLTDAKYYNDGSVVGGIYTKTDESGGISSLNRFNEKNWFVAGTFNQLVKKETNGEYNLSGNGNASYTINGLISGKDYTLSFMAKSANDNSFKVVIDTKSNNINISTVYPGVRNSITFTAVSDKATIRFDVSSDLTIKEIAVKEGTDIVYTQYATYRMGNVIDVFYQSHQMNATYSYYDVQAGEDTGGFALTNESKIIGYSNEVKNPDGWEVELIKLNEKSGINANYVVMGNDFNNDGTIATNERYAIAKGSLFSICLDGDACHYRYLLTSNSEDFKYVKTRSLTVKYSSYPEYVDKTSVIDIDAVDTSSLEGSNSNVNSNTISTIDNKTKHVMVNGSWYSIDSNFGRYSLFMEYLRDYNQDMSIYKYDNNSDTIYIRNDDIDYYKYEVLHDDNKLYNAVTDSYDKLDKGYTLETLYENETELQAVIDSLISSKDYLNEKTVVRSYTDSLPKLSQEKLYALYVADNEAVSYSCEDKNLPVTLENCTFTYKANDGKEPITLEDLLDDNLEPTNTHFGVIISNVAFNRKNPYYRYNDLDYKFAIDETKTNYVEYQRYLFGGYWEEKDVINDNTSFNHYSNDYAVINGIHTSRKNSYLTFYQINESGQNNLYVNNTSLYILYNSRGAEKTSGTYGNNINDRYFYAWISGDRDRTPYKGYGVVQQISATEIYSYITKASDTSEDGIGTRYILATYSNGNNAENIRIALDEMFVAQGDTKYLYQLKGKADSRDMRINNLISLADLEVLDMGKGIDADKLAGVNNVSSESVSYALKFSGMLNYWNTTINGDDFITQDKDAKTCTLDIQKVHQKNSTINFETNNGLETVSEFILQNRGKQGNNYKEQNTYDLYALTKVLDDGQYFDVTLGGSNGSNLITTFVEALNILHRNGYSGYMFNKVNSSNIRNASIELSKLDKSVFDWSKLAKNPELAEKWFGDSAYANLIYYEYVKGNDNVSSTIVSLYNSQTDFLYSENASGEHYQYYRDILKVLYSYLLFGVLIPDYQSGDSYPHMDSLKVESIIEKNILASEITNDKKSQQYITYKDEIIQTFGILLKNIDGMSTNDIDKTGFKIKFPQVIGTVVDSYSVFNDYNVTILPRWNENGVLFNETNTEIIMKMIPTLMYSNNMEENINIITDSFGSTLLEMHITNLLDYVSQINSSDYVFVKSNKVEGRYYIYKLLEASDKSGSHDGTVPAATIIRQNTIVDENNYSKYNDGNSLIALNDTNLTFMTNIQNAWEYSNTAITTNGWEQAGNWFKNVFTGTGLTGHTDEGNVLYALIRNGAYKEILKLSTINNLATYIWSTEANNTKYKPLNTYTSYSQINPVYIYNYKEVSKEDIQSASVPKGGPLDKLLGDWLGGMTVEERFRADLENDLEAMANNSSHEIGTTGSISVSIGSTFKLKQIKSDGTVMFDFKEMPSYAFKVVKKGQKLYDEKSDVCQSDYCVSPRLPYDYTLESYTMGGTYVNSSNAFIHHTDHEFVIKSDVNPDTLVYTNGHSTTWSFSNNDENHVNQIPLEINFVENNITEDTDYAIGKTNFSVSISDIKLIGNLKDKFAYNSNAFEYSLTYVPKQDKKCEGDNFEYNDFTGLCHLITKDKNELSLNNWVYEYTIPIKATYEEEYYDEEAGMSGTELHTIEENVQLFLSSRNISQEKIYNMVEDKLESKYSGYYHNPRLVEIDYSQEVQIHLNIYNTASSDITFNNLPADTTFTLAVQKRMFNGYTTNLWTKEFTTDIDMVMNPYGSSLSAKPTLTLTNEQVANGLVNGDTLLKEEYIPYDLQKCVFSYENSGDPTRDGVSVCGKYVISNKYRLQLSAAETIKIGFAIVDEEGNNVFTRYSGAIGEKVGFVEDIDAPMKKYHTYGTNNQNYSLISSNRELKNDSGMFYYNFNNDDFEAYKDYDSALDFVNNYVLQKYTIEITKKTYDYMNRYFRNHEFKVKIMEYYDDRFTYLDYNQNGKFDEEALSATYKYYDKNGVSTFYEKTNVEHYRDDCLAMSIDTISSWLSASLFTNDNEYPTFKPGKYNDKSHVGHYYIFGYDPNNQAQIVK